MAVQMNWLSALAISAMTCMQASAFANGAANATRFEQLYTAEWQWRKAQFADDENGDGRINAHLPDVSAAAQAQRLAYWQNVLRELDAIAPASLSAEDQINYQVYRAQIEVLIDGQKFRTYERPLNSDSSFWGNVGETARRSFRTEQDYRNYLVQLAELPRYFAQNIDNMRAGLKRGFTPPKISLQGRDAAIEAVLKAGVSEDNAFYAPFRRMPSSVVVSTQSELRAAALIAIRERVIPAHEQLLDYLRNEYIPRAQTSIAAHDLPNGRDFYRSRIREFTTLDLTPAEIHAIGLREVDKIKTQMHAVMQDVGFKGDLPAFLTFLRTDPQFYAKTPQELLMRAAWIAKQFDGKADHWFDRLPRRRFAIKPVPDDLAPYYTGGRGGPGIYMVNTYNLPARPLYSLVALTLHESAPGHAFQMPLAAENEDVPEFRRETYVSAYGEGWAVYAEKLGEEMGMYETPYDRFGMLSYQMWRATRLVVDTGIHAFGWTRERAQQFMLDNTALAQHEITTEVDRYIAWPGQALSYYLGQLAILEARAKAEKALGPKFDIRAFHDTVLHLGSVPLPVLHARIDRFIEEDGKGPYSEEADGG
jgi:uncharacterized protein (DUF885 family)